MADSDVLAQLFTNAVTGGAAPTDLQAFSQTAAANNPWRQAAAPVMGARFETSTWSPEEIIGTTLAQAFAGAVLNGIAQRSEATQLAKVAEVLPSLYANPGAITVPEGVDAGAFGGLKLATMTKNANREAELSRKLYEDLFTVEIAGKKKGKETKAELEAKDSFWNNKGSLDPESPRVKREDKLRGELTGNKELIAFTDVRDRVNVLRKAALDPRSMADNDFVIGVAKILDPGSVVRTEEGQNIINSNSIPQSILGMLNKAVNAETALDRRAIMDLAMRHYDTRKERASAILDNYINIASAEGIEPARILPFSRESLELGPMPTPEKRGVVAKNDYTAAMEARALELASAGLDRKAISKQLKQEFIMADRVK